MPRVSVGLPTYNRPDLLALVLEGFRQQTFVDFELIISDNASPDPGVQQLCERYANLDSRFRYVRQATNIGAENNFWFVYDQASAPLFMWASDDDLWPNEFLEKGVAALDENSRASSWFCEVVNINIHGEVVRPYPTFTRFQSGALKFIDLARFLWEPEVMGKANLIYSIFRREALSTVIDMFRQRPSTWGNDMNLVYGYLCRFNLVVDNQLFLKKRVPTETLAIIDDPRSLVIPPEWRGIYHKNYRRAAAGSGYESFTTLVLVARTAYDYWYSGRAARDFKDWRPRRFLADRRRQVWLTSVRKFLGILARIRRSRA